MRLSHALAAAAVLLVPANAQAGLDGAAGSAVYFFPDDTTPYGQASFSPPVFNVGAGVETIGNIENVTNLVFDFDDTSLSVVFDTELSNPTWTATSFNGVIVSGTAFGSITGISVNPTTSFAGFDASRASIVGNQLRLNWQGLSYVDGTTLDLNFTFDTVPEPASWALMIGGFGAVGAVARRRRALSATG